jgi:hypothetical protein
MFGTFQQSTLRIELDVPATEIRACLLEPQQFRQWLWPQRFSDGIPAVLTPDTTFTSYLGPITIRHQVTAAGPQQLRLLMAGGVDGFHEWLWGDGWVQSRLEGISLLPLNLAQTTNLWRLQQFLASSAESRETASEA